MSMGYSLLSNLQQQHTKFKNLMFMALFWVLQKLNETDIILALSLHIIANNNIARHI